MYHLSLYSFLSSDSLPGWGIDTVEAKNKEILYWETCNMRVVDEGRCSFVENTREKVIVRFQCDGVENE